MCDVLVVSKTEKTTQSPVKTDNRRRGLLWQNERKLLQEVLLYQKAIRKRNIKLKEQRKTNRELFEEYGFKIKQLKNFITNYNRSQRKLVAGLALLRKGRPQKILLYSNKIRLPN